MARRRSPFILGTAALAMLALVVGVLWVARPTDAQQQIDISGEWNFQVGGLGDVLLGCEASIIQDDGQFHMETECEAIGTGEFDGTIDAASGEFTASGQLVGIDVELAGTASADGERIEGTWSADLIGFSGTLTASRKGPPVTPTPLPTLPGPVDVTGAWRISFSGVFAGTCLAVIEQTGIELAAIADCPPVGTQRFSGALEQTTGTFSLDSGLIDIEGVIAADGNTVRATWAAFVFAGSLTGERADDIELIDATGNWDVAVIGTSKVTCSLAVEQPVFSATGSLQCDDGVALELSGTVDPFNGYVSLSAPSETGRVWLSARLGPEGRYAFGSFSDDLREERATLIVLPAGRLRHGVVLVNCRPGESIMIACAANVGEKVSVEVYVAVAPEGGFAGLQGRLTWPEAIRLEDASKSSRCTGAPPVTSATGATFRCPFAEPGSTFHGALARLSLRCREQVDATVAFEQGADFIGAGGDLDPPVLIGATVVCVGPQLGGPPPRRGDANCDGAVTSVDASLVLQYEAHLLDALGCTSGADVNRDGRANSLDASLILQHTAGLIHAFPDRPS